MDLNHLHLTVRDLEASKDYYSKVFDFYEKARLGADLLFLKNKEGFDLALNRGEIVSAFPDCIHFGFSFTSQDELLAIYMKAHKVFPKLFPEEPKDRGGYLSCVGFDPDGYHIELYWDPNLL